MATLGQGLDINRRKSGNQNPLARPAGTGGTQGGGRVGGTGRVTPAPPQPPSRPAGGQRFPTTGVGTRTGSVQAPPTTPPVTPPVQPPPDPVRTGVQVADPPVPPPAGTPPDDPRWADYYRARDEYWDQKSRERDREVERRANRRYENFYNDPNDPNSPRSDRPVRWYSDDDGATWIRDESSVGQFDEVYDNLDRAEDAARRIANWNIDDYKKNADPRYTNYQTVAELQSQFDELVDRVDAGTLSEKGLEYAAAMLGFTGGNGMTPTQEYQAFIRKQLTSEQPSGRTGGLTDAEYRTRQRALNNRIRMQQAQFERDVDNIYGESGSAMRAFQAADQYRRQISDARLQGELAIAEEDYMRMESQKNLTLQRVQMGLMAVGQAHGIIAQASAIQLQQFATRVSTAAAAENQLLARSAHDLAAVESAASLFVALSNSHLGLTKAVQDGEDRAWERHMRPAKIALENSLRMGQQAFQRLQLHTNAYMSRQQMESNERIARIQAKAQEKPWWSYLLEAAATVGGALIGGLIAGPAGAAAGGAAGAGVAKLTP